MILRITRHAAPIIAALVTLGAPPCTAAGAADDHEWEPLFNGRDLEGLTTNADLSAWAVIDGEIRVVKPGRGGWLRTTRMFRDFELALEFIIPEGGNSGVGLRGASTGDPAFTGFEVQIHDSDPDDTSRSACGAVYNAIPPAQQAVNAPGVWNTYRIRLIDDTLDVWLNDVHVQRAQRLDDRGIFRNDDQPLPLNERLTTGYIAFQDHGEGGLRLRNIAIRDLSPDPDPGDFQPILRAGGEDEWTHRGAGDFDLRDAELTAAEGPGHFFYNTPHEDIEFRAHVRVNTRGNGGLYFRTVPRPENPDTWPLGYEAQIDNHDPKNFTGCIYDMAHPTQPEPITRDNAWFDYRVRAVGDRIQTWINGIPMVDADLSDFDAGHLAIQTHHPGNRIEIRDLQIRTPADR